MKVVTQKSTDLLWKDEAGIAIPYSRTTKIERLMERHSASLLKQAIKTNHGLTAYKQTIKEVCLQVYSEFMAQHGVKAKRKGNFTWYNFDRSIKVEVSINERIEFDDLNISACKEKLGQFLDKNVESKSEFIKQLVIDAFETSRGKLDSKKVMSLLKYKSKIKDTLFQQAMDLLEAGIRKTTSKTYFRIWAKNEDGQYENIDLNFSSI